MRAGDKAADLGSRREGTIPILESRPTAAVSWRRLRASQPAFVKRSRPGEKAPLPQPARRRQGQRRLNGFLEVPIFWDFPVIF
jgi:hypothetical protein